MEKMLNLNPKKSKYQEDRSIEAVNSWRFLNRIYLSMQINELSPNFNETECDLAFDHNVNAADEALAITPTTWKGVHNFLSMLLDDFMSDDAERLLIGIKTLSSALQNLAPLKA